MYLLLTPARKQNILSKLLILILGVFFSSCSINKYIPKEEYLLNKNTYIIEKDSLTKEEYKNISSVLSDVSKYALQTPNSKFLGMRLGLRFYCLSSPNKHNWLNNIIRRQGSKPVLFNNDDEINTAQQIKLLLDSKGSFNSTVTFQNQVVKENRMNVTYIITPKKRYKINKITYLSENPNVQTLLNVAQKNSLLKTGEYYDQNIFSEERTRIATLLQNAGFYNATKDVVSFLVDTNLSNQRMDVELRVSNPKAYGPDKKITTTPLQRYYIDNIYIYPDLQYLAPVDSIKNDTLIYDYNYRGDKISYHFLTNKDMQLSESVISRSIFINPGERYSINNTERTYNSLMSLRNFKFIDVEYVESKKKSDTAKYLNVRIRLMNDMRQAFSTSFEISNTSPLLITNNTNTTNTTNNIGNFGLEWSLGYQNKNIFGGAELFNVKTTLALELAKSALTSKKESFYDIFSAFETGIDLSLDIPKFIIPFRNRFFPKRFRPRTIFSLGINYQFRTYFERALANTSFGYNWRSSSAQFHQLLPIEFTFVRYLKQAEEFQEQINALTDLRLKYQYTNHLIMNAKYTYVYNTQKFNTKIDFTYLSLNVETAGNLLYTIDKAFRVKTDSAGIYQLFGVPYSQYIRTEIDLKHYFYLSNKNTFVARIMTGIGIPYGNSISLPYEKSFYGGGPTTIRAWNIRTLGPGSYLNESINVFERVGDISLVINFEDRFHLIGIFEGAAFIDMGNIWLLHKSSEFPNGNFNFKTFIPQIAIGGGLGIRMNISIITLRLDFAIPFYDPQYPKGDRWRFSKWKWNQIVTNFGIDYPF